MSSWYVNLKKHFWNILFVFLLVFIVWQRVPNIVHNFEMQGQSVDDLVLQDLSGNEVKLPNARNQILVFWATWCVPCKIEMSRLKSAVESNEIAKTDVVTINMGEERAAVQRFVEENDFPFVMTLDESGIALRRFDVSVTPTIVHLTRLGQVSFMGSGVNPFTVWRAKHFLNSN